MKKNIIIKIKKEKQKSKYSSLEMKKLKVV